MNTLHRKIQRLDKNIKKRRALSRQQYKQAKIKLKDRLTSPAAFGIAFLTGVLIGWRGNSKKSPVENHLPKKQRYFLSSALSALYLVAEIPRILTFIGDVSKKTTNKR